MKFAVVVSSVSVAVVSGVPYAELPAGVVAPSTYTDYVADPNVNGLCVNTYQACGHVDWQVAGTWDYATCCAGNTCDPTSYTCVVDPNAGTACTSNQPPAGVAAPAGYCQYAQENADQAEWAACGHADWTVSSNWAYSTCATGLVCADQGAQWTCMKPAATWSDEDIAMMCSCCKNSCGFRIHYDCIETDQGTCGAYGSDYHWCDESHYNEATCANVKELDKLNWYKGELTAGPAEWPTRVFAPYLDGGLYPILEASKLQKEQDINYFILAFVVAKQDGKDLKCIPNIGAVQDIRTGPMSYNSSTGGYDYFWAETNEVRKAGGDVSVSFGGALNTELADCPACVVNGDVSNLVSAYETVVKASNSNHIDFDIEGAAMSKINKATGWTYRFQAVKTLSGMYPNLKISFTLPVLSTGLTDDGMEFATLMMQMDTPWDFFNMMTMDYGDSGCDLSKPNAMGQCEIDAIKNVAQQLYNAAISTGKASSYGWTSPSSVYSKMGSTPMLGLNDLTNEMYSLDDCTMVWNEVKSNLPLRLWSSWSIWRDQPCTLDYVDTKCSSRGPQASQYQSVSPAQTASYQYSAIQKQIGNL